MRSWRVRIGVGLLVLVVLAGAAWWQQRMMLCQDALIQRRAAYGFMRELPSTRDVGRYCFTWVGW